MAAVRIYVRDPSAPMQERLLLLLADHYEVVDGPAQADLTVMGVGLDQPRPRLVVTACRSGRTATLGKPFEADELLRVLHRLGTVSAE